MPTIYLHVGMPKCASTSIQGYFHRFDRRNREAGFVYPVAGRSTSGYFSHLPIVQADPDSLGDLVECIKAEAEGAETVFISSEEFANAYWDRPVIGALMRELNSVFGARNVRLLFLFRDHFSFIESCFAQFLKGGLYRVDHTEFFETTAGDIESYCNAFRGANGFDFFDYAYVVEAFRQQCDRQNAVEVYSIEPEDLATGDILAELCRRFSLVPPVNRNVKNTRFPVKALLALAYGIRTYGFGNILPRRKGVVDHFAGTGDGFTRVLNVHGGFAEAVAARQRADAVYFRRTSGVDFPALFQPRLDPPFSGDQPGEAVLTGEDLAWLDAHFAGR